MCLTAERKLLRSALLCAAAAVLAGGCSGDTGTSDAEKGKTGIPVTKICDGTLDAAAGDALQRLAGQGGVEESTGVNREGRPNKFSVSRSVEHLHDEYVQQSVCRVYRVGDNSGKPLLEVRFTASEYYLSGEEDSGSDRKIRYPLGLFARTSVNGAKLFFRCPTKAPSKDAFIGDTEYVKGELWAATIPLRGSDDARDAMTVLNSMSRAVAETAGCAEQADLPSRVPDGEVV
ncbi:hypothetical protein SUDANB105_02698 [Streptomyces sp. enrichment culture]|uniref:hypothetical protein n=1 Tax=Streptomyces sp. enrichment culture TaxID=1795815 RepID=UPI003F54A9C9